MRGVLKATNVKKMLAISQFSWAKHMRTGKLCGQAQGPLSLQLRLRSGLSFSDLAQAQESGSVGSSQNC